MIPIRGLRADACAVLYRAPQPIMKDMPVLKPVAKPISREILEGVAMAFHMTVGDLKSGCRRKDHVNARSVAVRLLRDCTWDNGTPRFSTSQIGGMLGERDHSTVCHALATFDDRAESYPKIRDAYEALRSIAQ